jgi:hypothetical protein
MKCVPGNSAQLLYWQIFECLDKIWRTWLKFQNKEIDIRGLTTSTRVLSMGDVIDLLKVILGGCWQGFRGYDPG